MKESKPIIGICAMFLLIGISNVLRYSEKLLESSQDVKVLHVIGLTAGGFLCGACAVGIIAGIRLRKKLIVDITPPALQASLSPSRSAAREQPELG